MKILFVLEHFYPYIGGAERLFFELTTTLAAQGNEVTVVTTQYDKQLPKTDQINGVTIHRVHCYNRFLFTVLSLPTILRIANNCDLIHTTTYNAAFPAWLAGKLKRKRVIITFHEVWGDLWWRLPFINQAQKMRFYLYEQLILKLSFYKYVAVSDFTKKKLEEAGIYSGRVIRIYNGLTDEEFEDYHHQPPKQFTYTFFGRLGISKGLDVLLPAAKQFSTLHPDSTLKLILPQKPVAIFKKVHQLIEKLELQSHVELLHNLPKAALYEAITHSSCVVIPSYSEGFCFVAAESVALGVPIISSQKGALEEVVSGKHLVIKPFDDTGLFAALVKARERKWMDKKQRKFLLNETVRAYLELYQDY